MATNMKEAIRLLGVYTANRFDPWDLAGNSKATCRKDVMSQLLGRKATVRESGVSAIRATFYNLLKIPGDCEANRHANFAKYCASVLNGKEKTKKETAQVIIAPKKAAPNGTKSKKAKDKEIQERTLWLVEDNNRLLKILAQ